MEITFNLGDPGTRGRDEGVRLGPAVGRRKESEPGGRRLPLRGTGRTQPRPHATPRHATPPGWRRRGREGRGRVRCWRSKKGGVAQPPGRFLGAPGTPPDGTDPPQTPPTI